MTSGEARLSSVDDLGLDQYRAIAPSAVAALVLGLASPLALIHPLLWIIPPLAAGLAAWALVQIAINRGLTGRSAALIGLMLALVFGSAAPARVLSRRWMLYHQARPVAAKWLELVRQGELEHAHQWTLSFRRRLSPGSPLKTFYANNANSQEELEKFFSSPPLQHFIETAPQARVQFAGNANQTSDDTADYIAQHFSVTCDENGRQSNYRIRTMVQRSLDRRTGRPTWQVVGLADPDTEE